METFVIFFGGGTALLMAIKVLVSNYQVRDFLACVFFASLAVILYYYGILISGNLEAYPAILSLDVVAGLIMVPAFYLFTTLYIKKTKKLSLWRLCHFLPAVVGVALTAPIFFAEVAFKKEMIAAIYSNFGNNAELALTNFGPLIYCLAYLALIMVDVYQSRKLTRNETATSISLAVVIAGFAAMTTLFSLGILLTSLLLLKAASVFSAVILLGWFLFGQLKPGVFQTKVERFQKRTYTYLKNQNVANLKKRVAQLMRDEKVYTNPDISVKQVARLMNISTHQLSELLNQHFRKRFNQYVNEFRIEEAKKLLLEEAETAVFSIGYRVGFSTPSMFNAIFRDHAGVTPRQYRCQAIEVAA